MARKQFEMNDNPSLQLIRGIYGDSGEEEKTEREERGGEFGEMYTLSNCASLLKCSAQTVRTYRKEGRIKAVKIGGRYMVQKEEIQYILKNGLHPVTDSFREKSRKARAISRKNSKNRK